MIEYLDALTLPRVPGAQCFIQRPLHFPTAIPGLNFVCAAVTPDFYHPDENQKIYEDVELLEVGAWCRRRVDDPTITVPRCLRAGMLILRLRYEGMADVTARFSPVSDDIESYTRLVSPASFTDYVSKLLRTVCGDDDSYSSAELHQFGGWDYEHNDDTVFLALHILAREIDAERLPWSLPFPIRDLNRPMLKQLCRTLGLPVGGKRFALITRILAHAFPTYFE